MTRSDPTITEQKIAVVGQGYVGLPVALRAVEVGFNVVGLEIDKQRVSELSAGRSYVADISSAQLACALRSNRYVVTDSYNDVVGFDLAIITVPTPLRETLPDLTFIEEAAHRLAPYITLGATIVLESTTYPGTTEELLVPALESGSGLRARRDFLVGYSPERIDPGSPGRGFVDTPKVVSGIDEASLASVQRFYTQLVRETVPVSSPRVAELTKLLENTFRHVNIALVNELAIFAHELQIDIWEAIDAASTKPFGYMRFTPGPGVGGHCLPVDPSYLSWQVRRQLGRSFRFVELANDINDHMPSYVVQRVSNILNCRAKAVRGSNILLVGLSYKKNTGDVREAPALKVAQLLVDLGATVLGADPHVEAYRWPDQIGRVELTADSVGRADLIVILTPHAAMDLDLLAAADVPVLDTQHSMIGNNVESI